VLFQNCLRKFEKSIAGSSQAQLVFADSFKEPTPQFFFKIFNLLADCRLGPECGVGSLCKAVQLSYMVKP
jgi:hypothetical protein